MKCSAASWDNLGSTRRPSGWAHGRSAAGGGAAPTRRGPSPRSRPRSTTALIDTAPAYGQGTSEEIVGKALEGRRDKVVLATKCGLVWHAQRGNHFFDYEGRPVHRYLGRDSIVYEVEQSLRRLRTDRIDHYITHWEDDPTTPIDETMEALETLKRQGKIRSIGASNTSPEDVAAYVAAGQLDAVQEEYSMAKRDIETTHLPLCAEHGISVFSYSSLALGLLSGRMGPEWTFSGDDQRKDNPRFSRANRAKVAALFKEIAPVIEAHGATAAQIIIARYLLGLDAGHTVIKAVPFDLEGRQVAVRALDGTSSTAIPGHVERDLSELWENAGTAIRACVAEAGVAPGQIGAVGCAGHGNGLYLIGAGGEPLVGIQPRP